MGYLLVVAAGVLQGSFMVPDEVHPALGMGKYLAGIRNHRLPGLALAYCLGHDSPSGRYFCIHQHALLCIGRALQAGVGLGCADLRIRHCHGGCELGFTIILGLAASAGALIPLAVLDREKLPQGRGLLTMGALVFVLVGIAFCSWAGSQRQPA
jgi:hypothetical protein